MSTRYTVLDVLRGIALINMIIYHALWDIVYIFGIELSWFKSQGAYIWQQFICCTFILLSGFCWHFGRNKLRRGIIVIAISLIISAVTIFFMPQSQILFGVLTLIGSSMLITILLDRLLKKINPLLGVIFSVILFLITKNINSGILWLGVGTVGIPKVLYANLFTAYLGFPYSGFFSTDYFSVIPWLFLYLTGYFLYIIFEKYAFLKYMRMVGCRPIEWIGRNSLIIYIVHQPIIYATLYLLFRLQ